MMRTHRAGDLRAEHDGQKVVVCGWVAHRRDHGGVVFLDVRDTAGLVQVVIDPDQPGCEAAHRVRNEWVLRVEGTVRPRPEGTVNPDLPTGEIEVGATSVEVLNEADPPPFPLDERTDIDESAPAPAPIPRPAARADATQPAGAGRGEPRDARGDASARLRRSRDADADRVDPGRRARLRRAVASAARLVLRAAAEPAAVQAAAHGRRPRPLLPDRAVPPRRRSSRRPPVRVHAARPRDELRRPGRRARPRPRSRCSPRPKRCAPTKRRPKSRG